MSSVISSLMKPPKWQKQQWFKVLRSLFWIGSRYNFDCVLRPHLWWFIFHVSHHYNCRCIYIYYIYTVCNMVYHIHVHHHVHYQYMSIIHRVFCVKICQFELRLLSPDSWSSGRSLAQWGIRLKNGERSPVFWLGKSQVFPWLNHHWCSGNACFFVYRPAIQPSYKNHSV